MKYLDKVAKIIEEKPIRMQEIAYLAIYQENKKILLQNIM